jgi:hypothetical protein
MRYHSCVTTPHPMSPHAMKSRLAHDANVGWRATLFSDLCWLNAAMAEALAGPFAVLLGWLLGTLAIRDSANVKP